MTMNTLNRGTVHLSLKAATVTASLIGATAFAIAPAGAAPAQTTAKTASAAAFSCHVYNNSGSEVNVRSGAGTTYSVAVQGVRHHQHRVDDRPDQRPRRLGGRGVRRVGRLSI